jgi:uncharacterized membrane protein
MRMKSAINLPVLGPMGIAPLMIASIAPVGMVVARILYTQHISHLFLVWNLFLAWIPLGLALLAWRTRHRPFLAAALGFLWLLFLPNAPYLVTDLIHLRPNSTVPMWYDMGMLFSFAFAGLALGLRSLQLMQGIVKERFGALASWIFALTICMISSFGIYIGRFLRWNSWEFLLHPGRLTADVLGHLASPEALLRLFTIVLLFGSVTIVGLLMFPANETTR